MTTHNSFDAPQNRDACPRCHAGRLRAWSELNDEERTVVQRLPASADHPLDERTAHRRWCTRCWHETTTPTPHDA